MSSSLRRLLVGGCVFGAVLTCSASVSLAGWPHSGYRHSVHRHVRHWVSPGVRYHYGYRHSAYPRYRHGFYAGSCYRPITYGQPRCGIASSYVNFGLGVANRFVAGCGPVRPWGYCPPRPCYRPYRSYWSWGYPREVFYSPRYNCVNYALPAVYYPAELGYGPQAVKQFMGVDRNFAMGPLTLTSYDAARDAKPSIELDPPTRVSNTRTLELAQRYVQFGDARFRGQQYHEALQRYRTATATAPDLASAHIKYGLTLAVTGRQEAAVKSIVRGLNLDPDWPTRGFALDDVYGDGRAAKIGHLDALARTVLADADSAEATYLLGVFLYLDGHKDRAQKILRRSADLMGDDKPIVPFTEPAPLDVKLAAVPL